MQRFRTTDRSVLGSAELLARLKGRRGLALATFVASLFISPVPLLAQTGGRFDAGSDAQDARNDALLATPNLATPQPLSSLFATAPGLEQQVPSPEWRFNIVAPLGYNSNAEEIAHGGTQTLETTPLGNLSWSAPVGASPLRLTLNTNAESDRYFSASEADLDKLGTGTRLQYVDPANDQAFSPYVAFAARWDFLPTFSEQISARQDFNAGFNKTLHFDAAFQPIPIASNTSASTVWSVGLTAFFQRREREPQLSSSAVFVIPSVTYKISADWNASLAVEFLSRWFDTDSTGFSGHDNEVLPIVTVEYVIPAALLGGERAAMLLGRPALDFQGSYLQVWSNAPGVSFDQWEARAAIKAGWTF